MQHYKVFSGDSEMQIGESEWAHFCSRYRLVEAAGGLVKNSRGEYLLIFRNGRWDLPKGKREAGESMEQTAVREVMEECGVDRLTLQGLLLVTYHTYTLQDTDVLKRTCWYSMSYSGERPKLQPQAEEGIEVAEFLPAEKVAGCIACSYPSIREVFAAERCLLEASAPPSALNFGEE
ncbi:MAG: NUDIX domain-containing protein [Prevotellaceae bacterium]|jgi:8-oxo-dGTP pyrophosphatase MutT (NUDIX family)|nr:NUDIX domain-containing protein [Prevotellaceae bacterium]